MRIGLGCMRLSTELARDEPSGMAILEAALDAGVALFDTARAYAPAEDELGHNERLVAHALRMRPRAPDARVVTKCGMRRDGGAWIPDGRAKSIEDDVAASIEALAGVGIDLLLLHAPDPRVAIATTARALSRALDAGVARSIGVSNVSRKQLEELVAHAPVAAVEVALGAYDDMPIRSGVVAYCLERGIEILAHAPFGGPERAARLARDHTLGRIAARRETVGPLDVFLAYLLAVRPEIVPIVGARRTETVRRIAAAETLALEEDELATLDARFPALGALRRPPVVARNVLAPHAAEVVLLMGVPGAGKSRAAEGFEARGYERLNRDTLGGTLRGIAKRLDERLAAGATRLVLDNTYVTRASRHDVVRVASSRGARVRCLFYETPTPEAQVNIVKRMIERFGRVVAPEAMRELARRDPAAIAPHALLRMARDLEPPSPDEGFAEIEVVPFVRRHATGGREGTLIALDLLAFDAPDAARPSSSILARLFASAPSGAPCLVYGWRPGLDEIAASRLRSAVEAVGRDTNRGVELAICAHPPGPPICWCRPPFPALFVAFAHRHQLDLRACTLFGASPTDRAVARSLGMAFTEMPLGDPA